VYALGSDGDIACLELASGKVLWQKNLQRDFGGKLGVWAYAESPLVDGDKVIVTPGGASATVVALDRKTGAVVWKSAVPGADDAGYASPMLMDVAGTKQVVQYMGKGLVGVDAGTGKFLWRFDKTFDTRFQMHAFTPIIDGNLVYTGSASAQGVARIGAAGAESVYIDKRLPGSIGGAVKVGAYIYGATQTGLACVEFASGKVMWEDRSVGANQVCAVDGKLIVHGENGDVALVAATPAAYQELGRFTPGGAPDRGQAKAWAYPVVSGGRLYVRDLGVISVYALR
jgi:outer membrane protein assembly factor BamB